MRELTIPAVAELAEAFLADLSEEQAQVLEELLLASLRAEAARVRYENLMHDAIAAWHDAPDGSTAATMELHQWLGMTWPQYKTWIEETK